MSFAEIMSDFFNSDTPGYALLTITASGKTIDGLFDNAYLDTLSMQETNPSFLCATTDAAAWLPNNTQVNIKNVIYRIKRREPDETGDVSRLILERQNG